MDCTGVSAVPEFDRQHLNDAQWSFELRSAFTGLYSTSGPCFTESSSVFIGIRVMSHVLCSEILWGTMRSEDVRVLGVYDHQVPPTSLDTT